MFKRIYINADLKIIADNVLKEGENVKSSVNRFYLLILLTVYLNK